MDTHLDAQDASMREDMVLAGHPKAIQRHVEPELLLNCRKPLEGQRRRQAADDRINRSIAEQIEGQDQVPPVHGGELMR